MPHSSFGTSLEGFLAAAFINQVIIVIMIINDSWQEVFSNRVLSKGYDYYLSGCVRHVRKIKYEYEAKVRGSYEYDVSVSIKDGELIDADCTCPYSAEGNFCKHEAALLYYLEDEGDEEADEDGSASDEIIEILNALSSAEMKNILLSLSAENQAVRDKLYEYSKKLSPRQRKDLLSEARSYFSYMDEKGYYDENKIYRAIRDFSKFLDSKIRPLLDDKHWYSDVFSLVIVLLKEFPSSTLYDYGWDSASDLENELDDLLSSSYLQAPDDIRINIEKEARRLYEKDSDWIIQDFLIYTVKDRKLAEKKLKAIRERNNEEWMRPVDDELALMKILDYKEEDILSWMYDNIENYRIQSLLFSHLLANGKWKDCIDALLLCKSKFGLNDNQSKLLKSLYRDHDMFDDLIALLKDEICNTTQYDLTNIKELKTLLDADEWAQFSFDLKKRDSIFKIKGDYLAYVEDWNALMKYIENERSMQSLDSINRYGDILIRHFPERMLTIYEKVADSIASTMHDRAGYSYYVSWLNRMRKTEEGKKRAEEKALQIIEKMSNRRALKDELRKAGFIS